MTLATLIEKALGKWTGESSRSGFNQHGFPDVSKAAPDTRRLIKDGRYCQVLKHEEFDEVSIECARRVLEHEMAFVPRGFVRLSECTLERNRQRYELGEYFLDPLEVDSFYMDRVCVTNRDYAKFVDAGGYDDVNLWPADSLATVLRFTDRTGNSGPRHWKDGRPAVDVLDHPVVGICWYEANAYSMWAGKRLPTSAEWQRAGTWPSANCDRNTEQRYPWGNAFDPTCANTWKPGEIGTHSVHAFSQSATPNGIKQLSGNVWEWVDGQFCPFADGVEVNGTGAVMAEIRGGGFDTYFASHATCQFRTGMDVMSRPLNVGLRCCIGIRLPETQYDYDEKEDG